MALSASAPLTTVPEMCIYDDQQDHIVVIARNSKLTSVRSTLQLSDVNASSLYHMLGQALMDMDVVRKAKARHAC